VADRLAPLPERASEAREIYLMVLVGFPESLEAARAREALQALDRTRASSRRVGAPRERERLG
jgi:hypothetical protein